MSDLSTAVRQDSERSAPPRRAARTALCALAAAVAGAATAYLAGIGSSGPSQNDTRDYPAIARANITSGCLDQGGDVESCLCILEATEETYTFTEMVDVENTMIRTGEYPPELAAVLEDAC